MAVFALERVGVKSEEEGCDFGLEGSSKAKVQSQVFSYSGMKFIQLVVDER